MGFQFNHVGGGTKTRRPITLHMKYNSACIQPHCFLITDEFGEQEASLEELQVCLRAWSMERAAGRQHRLGGRLGRHGMHHVPPAGTCCRWTFAHCLTAAAHARPFASLLPISCLQDYIENENARLDREAQFWCARDWKHPAACSVPALHRREGWGAASSAVVLCSHVSRSTCVSRLA